jgi:hypothetical protein
LGPKPLDFRILIGDSTIMMEARSFTIRPAAGLLVFVGSVFLVAFWCGALALAQTEPAKEDADRKNGTPSWFPSETKGREKELAEKILTQEDAELKHLALASLVRRWIRNDREAAFAFDKAQEDPRVRQTFFLAAAPILLEKEPELVLEVASSGRWWPEQYDHVGTAIQKMAHKDLDAAIEAFRVTPPRLQTFDGARRLGRLIAERDGPKAGIAFARSIDNPNSAQEAAMRGAMHTWVQMDEAAAVAYAEDQENLRDKSIAILGLLAGKGRNQKPGEVLKWAKTLADDQSRRLALANLAWLWDLEGNRPEVDRVLNDNTIAIEDRTVMEEFLRRMGVALP